MLYPIIPQTIDQVLKIFDLDSNSISLETIASHNKLKSGEPINKIDILFKKIEKKND
jgi:methionyl-tRNA synthetase